MPNPNAANASRPPRREHARTGRSIGAWTIGLALAATAGTAPALAEAHVQRELRERLGVDDDFAIDLDLRGLEVRNLERSLADGRGRVTIERVRVRPDADGVRIEIDGMQAELSRARPTPLASTKADPPRPQAAPRRPAATERDPIVSTLRRLRGVPIRVETKRSTVRVELSPGVVATADDPEVELAGDGRIVARGRFELSDGAGPAWARATLELAARDESPRDLALSGALDLDLDRPDAKLQAEGLTIIGRVTPELAHLGLREPGGGEAEIRVQRTHDRDTGTRGEQAEIDATDMPLALLTPVASLLGERVGDRLGDKLDFDFSDARMDGHVELARGGGLTRATVEGVEVRGLGIDSELVAPQPVAFDPLAVDGTFVRRDSDRGRTTEASFVLGHGPVQVQFDGHLDDVGIRFDLQLPEIGCQALIDGIPGGAAPILAGTALSGTVAADIGLDVEFSALAEARDAYTVDGELILPDEEFVPPGDLTFEFPFLESCAVERLGPGVDVDGVRGSYHHDFVTASGRVERRVLAVGDERYASLDAIPEVALAFVILEDARFWTHDGFDREQIERAFWFNLIEGRVRRGASTISQQAARSLWLGIDRSMTRKLAEALLAAELERTVGKQRILEVYLNVIELGPDIHGVVEASEYHFGRHPNELNMREALHLASLAPAPVAYSKRFADGRTDPAWRAHLRRQVRRLRIRKLISRETARRVNEAPLRLRPHPELR